MKSIEIQGKNNIKKITGEEQKRNIIEINNINYLDYKKELELVNNLYLNNEINAEYNKEYYFIKREIQKKISNYKSQDIKKNIFNKELLINLEELLEKLVVSKLKCYYCNNNVKVLYEIIRDPNQWSLDRIDNNLCHSCDNTVVSCLKCNLQRRVTDYNKFNFTKKLRLNKIV
jgi:hypothetical protein